jgi:DNA-binding CsgD family transcriptional regulator
MIGTTLADILPAPAAKEREALLQNVLDTGTPCSLVQFGNDKRLLCRVLPIDEDAFGYRGVLCLLTEGPLIGMNDGTDERSTLVRTPYLDDLAALTKAELRTLYDIACGRANQDIADRQYRSVRTIENHVESIHKKLGTPTRSALVRLATERGVQGFTAEEWNEIVDGSAATRKAAPPAKKQALLEAIATATPPAQDSALN